MRCLCCDHENRAERRFCAECGAALAAVCAACGTSNEPGEKFCGQCGASLRSTAGATPLPARVVGAGTRTGVTAEVSSHEAPDGERKMVTALFADIKGSMELLEDLDPEEARAIVDPALNLMTEAVRRYDGYVAQSTGDGIFALFGAPVAHEDHPQRALYAALRMQEELKRYSDRLRAEGRVPIQVRVGVNAGEVVVRSIQIGTAHPEYTPIGHSVSLAARMQALAPIGSIATTERVRKLCEGYFAFKDLGPSRVKGVSEPVEVFEVTGLGPLRTRLQRSASRGLTKFVGRQREMDAIEHAAEQAKIGRGQIVAAIAEAGMGKSRLFYEFKVRNQAGWMVLEAVSVSHGKASAYLPVIDVLHSYFRIAPDDDRRTRREKVTGRLLTLDPALEAIRPYVFALLGLVEGEDPLAQMDAQLRRRRTQEAIKRVLLRESLNQPLLVIFEDLHWIDEETQSLLNLLADSIGTSRLLLLVNYRPEYTHTWGNKTYYTQLRLDPLGRETAEEMLGTLLGNDTGLIALKRLIAEKTEGNPFFMEEIVQALSEEGVLQADGVITLAQPLNDIRIPATVQAILAARIDRLRAEQKELLQTVAVIGREFPLTLVRAVTSHRPEVLDRMLNDLQLAEFIYEQPAVADTEYIFKHALTSEVAYNSVLIERRKVLHERVAQAIEAQSAGRIDDHVADLAFHYGRSDNAGKAAEYSQLAGRQATRRSAYVEAIAYLTSGLNLLKRLPEDAERNRIEIDLQLALVDAVRFSQSLASGEIETALARAGDLCEKAGDNARLFEVLNALTMLYLNQLKVTPARRAVEQLNVVADRIGDPVLKGRADCTLAVALMFGGKFASAHESIVRALGWLSGGAAEDVLRGLRLAAMVSLLLGYPERAREYARDVIAHRERAAPQYQRDVLFGVLMGEFHIALRDAATALDIAERAIRFTLEHAPALSGMATFHRGWALALLGQSERGLADMVNGRQAYRANDPPTRVFIGLAEGYIRARKPDDALAQVDEGLAVAARSGIRMYEAELQRVKGEAWLCQTPPDRAQAEACFREAIADRTRPGGKMVGAEGYDDPRAAAARYWTPRRSAHHACRHLRLVHRGL